MEFLLGFGLGVVVGGAIAYVFPTWFKSTADSVDAKVGSAANNVVSKL